MKKSAMSECKSVADADRCFVGIVRSIDGDVRAGMVTAGDALSMIHALCADHADAVSKMLGGEWNERE